MAKSDKINNHFDILRWDVIEDPCTGKLCPMAYFVPSTDFIIYSNLNDNRIYVDLYNIFKEGIRNDDYMMDMYNPSQLTRTLAVIDKSSDIPNCRTNFFDETNAYVLYFKDLEWNGYPTLDRKPKFSINDKIAVPDSVKQVFKKPESTRKPLPRPIKERLFQAVENFDKNDEMKFIGDCPPDCCDNSRSDGMSSKLTPLEITLIVITLIFLFLLVFGGLSMIKKVKKINNKETF